MKCEIDVVFREPVVDMKSIPKGVQRSNRCDGTPINLIGSMINPKQAISIRDLFNQTRRAWDSHGTAP
jgi:hypothetical protein